MSESLRVYLTCKSPDALESKVEYTELEKEKTVPFIRRKFFRVLRNMPILTY